MDTPTNSAPKTTAVIVSPRRKFGAHGNAYREEYCLQIREFFESAPQTTDATVAVMKHANYVNHHSDGTRFTTGSKREEVRRICAALPTFERFATSIGVTTATLRNWRAKYPEFEEACRMCEQIQRDFLQQGLLNGSIPPNGGIFVAKNVTAHHDTPMVDKIEHGITNVPEGVEGERPALAERTPEELARLRQLVEEARALGVRVMTD
jgi:hypothetical protein